MSAKDMTWEVEVSGPASLKACKPATVPWYKGSSGHSGLCQEPGHYGERRGTQENPL